MSEQGRAPVWTSLWKVDEDFSGYGDVRLPWALQLDAAIGALAFALGWWFAINKLGAAGRLTTLLGPVPGAVVALVVIFGAPFGVYRLLDSTHPDGRGRLRRAMHIAEALIRSNEYPADRLGRHTNRPPAGRLTGAAGHHHRWRNPT